MCHGMCLVKQLYLTITGTINLIDQIDQLIIGSLKFNFLDETSLKGIYLSVS